MIYKVHVHIEMIIGFSTFLSYRELSLEEVDGYREYLGDQNTKLVKKDSRLKFLKRVPKRGKGKPSTIVCNHLGFIEAMGLVASPLCPGFTPKDSL